jgi:hypothetical protein
MRSRERHRAGPAIQIRLDPSVPWEALIERRLETLAPARRSSWIRDLLVAGFREECLVRRQLAATRPPAWRVRHAEAPQEPHPVPAVSQPSNPSGIETGSEKPFKALRNVIG